MASPKYQYSDMVRAYYSLVTEYMCILHMRLVLGIRLHGWHARLDVLRGVTGLRPTR